MTIGTHCKKVYLIYLRVEAVTMQFLMRLKLLVICKISMKKNATDQGSSAQVPNTPSTVHQSTRHQNSGARPSQPRATDTPSVSTSSARHQTVHHLHPTVLPRTLPGKTIPLLGFLSGRPTEQKRLMELGAGVERRSGPFGLGAVSRCLPCVNGPA